MRGSSGNNILPHISEPSYTSLNDPNVRRQRYPWKKLAVGAGIVLFLWWFIDSSKKDGSFFGGDSLGHAPPIDDADYPHLQPPPSMPHEDDIPSKEPSSPHTKPFIHPTSFETDPDAASTTYCSSPYSGSKPLVQYALMIDAGSQGSRIHAYKFNNCKATLSLEYETFVEIRPGLSAYASDAEAAAESLDKLMDEAVRVVPKSLVRCTPVAVKATAGLRFLGPSVASSILAAVRTRLRTKYPFELPSTSADGLEERVAIMDGADEGVYAWITSNYLLGTIGSGVPAHTNTYAVLDLGGASTQIVFEPTFSPSSKQKFLDGEHKYELTFAGRKYVLYQHSYLGYGLMKARSSVHNLVAFLGDVQAANHKVAGVEELTNPCISQNQSRAVMVTPGGIAEKSVTMTGHDTSSFASCSKFISLILAKDSLCSVKPCSFDGQYQPSILDTFPSGGILTLSYFTDRLLPFLEAGVVPGGTFEGEQDHSKGSKDNSGQSRDGSTMKIKDIATLAAQTCLGPKSWAAEFSLPSSSSSQKKLPTELKALQEELEGRPEECLDLTFMYSLLRLGYEFGDERVVRVAKKVGGVELGWALGAALALLDGDLKCRA